MKTIYELNNTQFSYDRNTVLSIDHFEINAGDVLAIVGPNGSGKSTLLNLLALLLKPDGGQLRFKGINTDQKSIESLKRNIGYVQQNPYLFNSTVLKNIEIGLKLRHVNKKTRHNRAISVMEQLGIYSLGNKRAHELSGGEVQKVALARAIVLEPDVLIMDEPFTYLDKSFITEFEKMLVAIKESCLQTVIFSTHDQLRARIVSDRIYSIINGKLFRESTLNLFQGKLSPDHDYLDTGKIRINLPHHAGSCSMIVIEPTQIVLSRSLLESSMRNCFTGKIKSLNQRNEYVDVVIDAGEIFHSVITESAFNELGLKLGEQIWLSFKTSSVKIL